MGLLGGWDWIGFIQGGLGFSRKGWGKSSSGPEPPVTLQCFHFQGTIISKISFLFQVSGPGCKQTFSIFQEGYKQASKVEVRLFQPSVTKLYDFIIICQVIELLNY